MARKRLGEILLEAGLIDEATLRVALTEQRRFGGHLGRVLVDMKKVLEEDLVAALSRQLAVPVIDLDHLDIAQAVIELVPGEMAEAYSLIPFAQPMKFLDVAMGDPTNQTAIDELRVRTQLNIRTYLAGPKAMERALHRYYGRGLGQTINGRRVRSELALDDVSADGDMELVGGYDLDLAARTTTATRGFPRAGAAGSSPAVARIPTPATGAQALSAATPATGTTPAVGHAAPVLSSPGLTPPVETRAPTPLPVSPSPSTTPPPASPQPGTVPSVTRTDLVPPGPTAPSGARVPTMAEIAALHERIANLEALVRRDEDVLKKLMALLIEKGVATRDEIIAKLR
jgi:hypothetical protein